MNPVNPEEIFTCQDLIDGNCFLFPLETNHIIVLGT